MKVKDLKAEVKADKQEKKDAKAGNQDGAMMPDDKEKVPPAAQNPEQMTDQDRAKYQQQVQEIYQKYNLGRPQQISQQLNSSRILRAVYSERQLQEQMVDFWSNHFNVYANKQSVRWFLPEYDRDVIRPNSLGNFKDLLLATAQSPAMLYYLDNFQSVGENNQQTADIGKQQERLKQLMNNPKARERFKQNQNLTDEQVDERIKQMEQRMGQAQKQKRGINENYAREIMELHTLGVDGGYSLKDIQEIARCFTGWTITDPRGYKKGNAITGTDDKRGAKLAQAMGLPENTESGKFYFNERVHDNGVKIVLGQTINEGGIKDGLKVIDILAHHPSTAKFISRKLAVKFVNDNPSEELVNRMAEAFTKSNGDIKTTLRAMINSPEFFAPENYRAKIKTPLELVVSGIRTIGADTNGNQVQGMLAKMGQQLYNWQAPTGYPDMAEDWVNTGALLERMNFAVALASNRIPGTKANLTKLGGTATGKQALLTQFSGVILNGEISDATKSSLLKQLDQPLMEPTMTVNNEMSMENVAMERPDVKEAGGGKRNGGQQGRLLPPSGDPEVFKVVGLILGSPDFQRQ
jgi:uncharacterized protein (DUF1800 family)